MTRSHLHTQTNTYTHSHTHIFFCLVTCEKSVNVSLYCRGLTASLTQWSSSCRDSWTMFKLCCHTCEIRRYLSSPTPSHSIQTPDLAARTIHDSELLTGGFIIYCNDSSRYNNSKEGSGKVMRESFYRISYATHPEF